MGPALAGFGESYPSNSDPDVVAYPIISFTSATTCSISCSILPTDKSLISNGTIGQATSILCFNSPSDSKIQACKQLNSEKSIFSLKGSYRRCLKRLRV